MFEGENCGFSTVRNWDRNPVKLIKDSAAIFEMMQNVSPNAAVIGMTITCDGRVGGIVSQVGGPELSAAMRRFWNGGRAPEVPNEDT